MPVESNPLSEKWSEAFSKILRKLLDAPSFPKMDSIDNFTDWWKAHWPQMREWPLMVDQAIVGGFSADRVGFALGAGFQAGLRCLISSIPEGKIAAFCISEEEGNRPKHIRTKLQPHDQKHSSEGKLEKWVFSGKKKWTTLAAEAEILYVAVNLGEDAEGRFQIRLVSVESNTPGVRLELMKYIDFIPEISHGIMHFEDVSVTPDQFLSGDGYSDYIKPFRAIEDTYVSLAVLSYILQVAMQSKWPRSVQESILSLMIGFRSLGQTNLAAPEIHISLGGLLAQKKQLMEKLNPHWEQAPEVTKERWHRDSGLFHLSEKVNQFRLEAAWKQFQ